jgi:hypothetical protein
VFLGNAAKSLQESYNLPLSSLVLMNTGVWHNSFQKGHFPPPFFVCMTRNGELCAHNDQTIASLAKRGIPAGQVTIDPLAIHREFFFTKGFL